MVTKGEKVELVMDDETWAEAKVIDPLATQFTCKIKGQKAIRFFFYADKGITWRKLDK